MCFGSKDKSNDPAPKPAQFQPPQQASSSSSSKPTASMPQQQYAPPAGPPPSHAQGEYAYQQQPQFHQAQPDHGDGYAPPPGPPPSHRTHDTGAAADRLLSKNNPFFNTSDHPSSSSDFAPPPGPPPPPSSSMYTQGQSGDKKQQQQHDWQTAVPDTSLLPPPPSFFTGYDRSPANNATEEECEAGERWCAQYPLYPAMPYSEAAAAAALHGNVAVYAPPDFRGAVAQAAGPAGVWRGRSEAGAGDTCLATYPPLYHAAAHTPRVPGRRFTAYYEVRILEPPGSSGNSSGSRSRRSTRKEDEEEVGLAIGFVAPPYPGFRLPGWHRGSLGVHGDDGRRYVNDRWGGRDFARPFRRGETVGLGMEFFLTNASNTNADGGAGGGGGGGGNGGGGAHDIGVEVFFTRDGREAGRWDLHEETDRVQDLPVTGLEGYNDVCAAVGVFDKVAFEVVFAPERWLWKGNDRQG
ncbi:hypothetical protein Hte_012527 [Hypoxylon texense]